MSGPFGSSQWMYKSGGYEISNSVRFDDATSAHMTMTPGAAGDRRLWTWSAWVKHCLLYTSPSPRDLSTSRMPSSA